MPAVIPAAAVDIYVIKIENLALKALNKRRLKIKYSGICNVLAAGFKEMLIAQTIINTVVIIAYGATLFALNFLTNGTYTINAPQIVTATKKILV